MNAKHTPVPYSTELGTVFSQAQNYDKGFCYTVARCSRFHLDPQGMTDAAFIVRACNSHAELLAALSACVLELECDWITRHGPAHTNARAAIARATEG